MKPMAWWKRYRVSLMLLVVSVAAFGAALTGQGDERRIIETIYGDRAKEPWKLQYKAGTVARGVVLNETKQTLYLDGDPCKAKVVYQFTEPFEKDETGEKVKCNGATLTEYQVKQGTR
jgi:hypothetical protein